MEDARTLFPVRGARCSHYTLFGMQHGTLLRVSLCVGNSRVLLVFHGRQPSACCGNHGGLEGSITRTCFQ